MVWHRNALKAHRTSLRAYPSEFRNEYGEEMERLFAMRLRVEPPIRWCLESFADVAITAPREHLEIPAWKAARTDFVVVLRHS